MYQSKARRDYCPNIYCADGTGKNNIPKPDKMSTVHTVLWQILVFLDLFFKALESNSECTKFMKKNLKKHEEVWIKERRCLTKKLIGIFLIICKM